MLQVQHDQELRRKSERLEEIDLMKMDCEGCEHSVLGTASTTTLSRIRFIVGEYHELKRFYALIEKKLFSTHKVNLIGNKHLGAFFAERLAGKEDGILRCGKRGMLVPRPCLSDEPIDWHLFNEEFVLPAERKFHALE